MDFDVGLKNKPELNMAPLIDVVFLLLIFFMLTSSMIQIESINLDLPSANSAVSLNEKLINISITRQDVYYLNKQKISESGLKDKLLFAFKENADKPVILSVEKTATAEAMVKTMDLIRNAGGRNISLATKK